MRIVGGTYKGHRLVAPKGDRTRPTTDRTRESLFNILQHREGFSFDGARVIDAFAGSGALGFEALSRGADFALFIDTDAGARGAIRDNIEALGLFGTTRIHRRDATALGPKPSNLGAPFSLVFMDPPYRQGFAEKALAALNDGAWLAPGTLVVLETAADETIALKNYAVDDERVYGDTKIWFLMYTP